MPMIDEIGGALRRKLTVEEKMVLAQDPDKTDSQIADEADEWIMVALDHLYNSAAKDRLAKARMALIYCHGKLVLLAARKRLQEGTGAPS